MAAHLFLLYYAVLSAITPPVAVAAFAAASIANDNPMKISFKGVQFAVGAFLLPFFFVLDAALLGEGSVLRGYLGNSQSRAGVCTDFSGIGWLLYKSHKSASTTDRIHYRYTVTSAPCWVPNSWNYRWYWNFVLVLV